MSFLFPNPFLLTSLQNNEPDKMSNPEKFPLSDTDEKPDTLHREYTLGQDGVKSPQHQGDYSGARKKTDPVEIRLVRKLDTWIMPTLWLMYWLNYLDRNAIALARLNDLEEDLNLSSSEYQTCVSILFVGYLLGQVPSSESFWLLLVDVVCVSVG